MEEFVNNFVVEELDRKSNGAPLYNLLYVSGYVEFVGTLPEIVAYLQLKAWYIDGILNINGREL